MTPVRERKNRIASRGLGGSEQHEDQDDDEDHADDTEQEVDGFGFSESASNRIHRRHPLLSLGNDAGSARATERVKQRRRQPLAQSSAP